MAEFGIQATQLANPQGAGSAPLSPVRDVSILAPVTEALGLVGNVFVKGLEQDRKDKQLAAKNSVISNFTSEQTAINDAVATGQLKPTEAAARSRAVFNKYAAGYSEYIDDIGKAANVLRGNTELGTVEDEIKQQKVIRDRDIAQAQARGLTILPDMSPDQVDAVVYASKLGIQNEARIAAEDKRAEAERAAGRYDAEVSAQRRKQTSLQLISEQAGAGIDSFNSVISSLANSVKLGKRTSQEAQQQLALEFTKINGVIQAAAGIDDSIAAPYRSLFSDLNEVGKKMLNPETNANEAQAQVNSLLARAQLVALQSSPSVKAAVVASKFFPNSTEVALKLAPRVNEVFSIVQNMPIDGNQFVPNFVGNPEVESGVLELMKKSIEGLPGVKPIDKDTATKQGVNIVNQTLKQVGNVVNQGNVEAKQLSNLADFFASSQFGSFASTNQLDTNAMNTAKRVFQLVYEPTVVKGIQQKLEGDLEGRPYGSRGKPRPAGNKVIDAIDIQFNGAGVTFVPKDVKGLNPDEQLAQKQMIVNLRTTEKALNQLIHIGAHMEGSTDYAKVWEENRHIFVPKMFSAPVEKPAKSQGNPTNKAEREMVKSVALSPSEAAADEARNLTPENIKTLQTEINKAKDPMIRKALQDEMDRIQSVLRGRVQ